jgi:hypothetical protein
MFRTKYLVPMTIIAATALPNMAYAQDVEGSANPIVAIEPTVTAVEMASNEQPIGVVLVDTPVLIARDANVLEDDILKDGDLLQMRGGHAIVVGNQTLTAISNGNAFTGNYTAGSIALADNALSNFNGLGNLVINTGAQNNLQSAMNVTINFAQ